MLHLEQECAAEVYRHSVECFAISVGMSIGEIISIILHQLFRGILSRPAGFLGH